MTHSSEPTDSSGTNDGLHGDDVPTGPSHPAAPRRRRALVLAGAAVLAAAIVVIGIAVIAPSGDDAPATDGPGSADESTTAPSQATEEPQADAGGQTPSSTGDSPADREQPPVELGASPTLSEGITLRVESLSAVDGEAALPGEIGGPAVAATIAITNSSDAPLDLSSLVVNAYSGEAVTPANPLSTGTISFPASAAAGTVTTATYVFAVPEGERDQMRVTVDTSLDLPTIVFEGAAG